MFLNVIYYSLIKYRIQIVKKIGVLEVFMTEWQKASCPLLKYNYTSYMISTCVPADHRE